jgi:eukaryotic-like serine/threonine-protein kinase
VRRAFSDASWVDRASHWDLPEAMRSMSAPDVHEPAKTSEPLLREGDLLGGRYRIGPCLGGGGMASVFRATHVGLDQPVAIKIVSPLIRELPGVVSRFMREARAASRLAGEHVVRVFDVGTTADGAPYLVMELLEGRDLSQLLDEGFCPTVDVAVDIVLQACEALAEVHGLGIVHRDLKPANLFLARGPDGLACLKLIDFGISRVDSPLSPKDAVALTNPEIVMGSPRYMPPEQMESAAAADSRSDIWGLGAILYEMLVGNAPFDGDSLLDIYAAAVRAPPPSPSALRSDLPDDIDEVILRCLRVEPRERYADVAELAEALAAFGDETSAAKAQAIARVLAASRVRSQTSGVEDIVIGRTGTSSNSTTSRIRRRMPPTRRSVRPRRLAITAAVAVLLGAAGLAARPLATRLELSPSVSVSGAAAATQPRAPSAAPVVDAPAAPVVDAPAAPATDGLGPAPETGVPTGPVVIQSETPTALSREPTPPEKSRREPAQRTRARAVTSSSRATSAPRATSAAAMAPRAPSPAWTVSTAVATDPPVAAEPATSDLAPEPAPPARATPTRSDDRTLFEERK